MQLSTNQYRQQFLASAQADEVMDQLRLMEVSAAYHTKESYSPSSLDAVTFTDKHFTYICSHPAVKPQEYLANLRLMTKVRSY